MPKIPAKIIFLFTTAVLLSVILFQFLGDWSFPDTRWPIEKGEKVKISSDKSVVQKFVAGRDGLARIKVLFGNSDIGKGGKLEMKIYDETCSKLLRNSTLAVTSLDSGDTKDFKFPRIPDSQGKIFCLDLRYNGAKSASVFLVNDPAPESKFLSVDGQELPNQALAMRPAYQNASWQQNILELDQRISQYKPWFLKGSYLLAIVFFFLIFAIFAVILLIMG
jgi:hypothetical protein